MRIAVFSADPVIGEALSCLLSNTGGMEVVACLSSLVSAAPVIESQRPDLLLVTEDFNDEVSRGALRRLKQNSGVKTMLLHSRESVDAGLLEEFDRVQSRWPGVGALCEALRKLSDESDESRRRPMVAKASTESVRFTVPLKSLTVRERETSELVALGMSNMQIANALGISEPTVKLYVSKLLRLFDCENRVQLALKLTQSGTHRPETTVVS